MQEKEETKRIFEEYSVPKALRIMAIPTIMGQLIVLFYNLADTFFIGKTNNPAMVAGASLILPYFNLAISLAGLSGVGGGIIISRLLGKGEPKEARKVSTSAFLLASLSALLFSLTTFVFMDPILHFLGATEETYHFAYIYAFCVIVLGAFPTVLSQTMATMIRSMGHSKEAGFGITMGGLLNIALDPIFMFLIFPRGMGTAGAGVATLLSNIIVCFYFFRFLHKSPGLPVTFALKEGLVSKAQFLTILAIGFPSALNMFLFDLDCMLLNKLMSVYGAVALAALGIVVKAERLPLNIGIGISQGMMPIVAYNYAAQNKKRTKDTVNYARNAGILVGICSVILYLITAPWIIRFFIKDQATIQLGARFLRARAIATPLMFLSFFHMDLFQGFGKSRTANFLSFMRWAVFNIPMLLLLSSLLGIYGIVCSQVLADILTVTLSFYRYHRFIKKEF